MKVYSLLRILKIICFLSVGIFFVSFMLCALFSVDFDVMVFITIPFVVFIFAAYSGICIIDMGLLEKKSNYAPRRESFLCGDEDSDILTRTQTETKAAS